MEPKTKRALRCLRPMLTRCCNCQKLRTITLPIINSYHKQSRPFTGPEDHHPSAMSFFERIGAPNTPSSGGSLFGTPASTQQPGGGLFGNTQTSTPATGTGLFGTPSTANTATPGSLFGTPASSAGGSGGLFGTAPASTTTTSAPSAGGLFPMTTTQSATTSAPGLFGTQAPGTASASTGVGLFGTAPASSAPATTSLFGTATTQAPKPSLNLFGANTTQSTSTNAPPTSRPSLFGSTAPAQTSTTTTQMQPSGMQQAVKIDWSNLMPFHKLHELADPVRQQVEEADAYILSEMQKSDALAAAFPEHREMVQSVPVDAELMERRLMTANSFLQSDASALETLVKHQKQDDQHASLSVRTLDLLRLPHAARMLQAQYNPNQSQHQQTLTQSQFATSTFAPLPTVSSTTTNETDITSNVGMINYFNRHTSEMEMKLRIFLDSVAEVEASLRSVESQAQASTKGEAGQTLDSAGAGGRQDVRRLHNTLREFYNALNDVSVRVVDAKEGLRDLKQPRATASRRV